MELDHPHRQRLLPTLARIRTWRSSSDYYALTLTASLDNRPIWSAQTHWVGPSECFAGWERRAASVVDPAKMTSSWDELGQSWLVVSEPADLGLWIRLGGNALVETALAHERLPGQVEAREVAPNGPVGFLVASSLSDQQRRRQPTRGVGKRVSRRDGAACRRCGRTSGEVRLTKHHVLPYSAGGLTQENNLVSLCDDCHRDCHARQETRPDPSWLYGVLLDHEVERLDEGYETAVRRHRHQVATLLAERSLRASTESCPRCGTPTENAARRRAT